MAGTTLHIRQNAPVDGKSLIRLTLKRPGEPDRDAEATIEQLEGGPHLLYVLQRRRGRGAGRPSGVN